MLISFDEHSTAYPAFFELAHRRCAQDSRFPEARWTVPEGQPHRFFLTYDDRGQPVARLLAIVSGDVWRTQRVGLLGLYEALAGTPERDISTMLDAGCTWLADAGCGVAVGPLNGSTWFDYRFAVPGGGRPFFLDASNPDEYPGQWRGAGFTPIEHYRSVVFDRAHFCFERVERFGRRLSARGISVSPVCAETFHSVLPEIHALCLEAFSPNPLFTPIDFAAFSDLYQPAASLMDSSWSLIARGGAGRMLGFAFAFPDFCDTARKSLVVKTVAVRQDTSTRGLGAWLSELLHKRAHERGYERIYHALMHDANPSTHIHRREARTWRKYELLGRAL
jgi:GNAT superfamily N-acetyltransferase